MKTKTNSFFSQKVILALFLILIILSTCTRKSFITDPFDRPSPLSLKISFTDITLLDLIHKVVLIVSLPGGEIYLRKELTLQDGKIKDQIEVPAGENRVFTLEALDSTQTVIYKGADTAKVVGAEITEVKINLSPAVFLLKLDPVYQEVTKLDAFFVDVKLYNVQNLFGIAFRVDFDSSVLFCTDVSSGDLLGSPDSTIFFSKVDTLKGYVACGYSQIQDAGRGVSGSGRLARLHFKARDNLGENPLFANLAFNQETLSFYDLGGENPEWKDSVYIHNAQLLIQNSARKLGEN